MEAKTIQRITGVSRTTIYNEKLQKMNNAELKNWLTQKLQSVSAAISDLENARDGYNELLSLLSDV